MKDNGKKEMVVSGQMVLTDPDEMRLIEAYRDLSGEMRSLTWTWVNRLRMNMGKDRREDEQIVKAAAEQYARWVGEAEDLKKEYPEFSLEALLEDDQARKMLGAGVTMRNAYRAVQKA